MRSTQCCKKKNARLAKLRRSATPLVFLALLAGRAHPQETTLRSQANVVLVPALVKDSQGGIAYGLAAKDFVIEDDGVEQSVRLDEAAEGQSISLVLAIQRGGRASYEFPRMRGLKSMLDPLFALGLARVAVVEFDSQVELTQSFTEDESLIDADLTNLQPGDSKASILDAISYSVGLLKSEPPGGLRALLLISEIRDHGSKLKIEDAVAAIGESNSLMYALSFSPALSNILDTERGTNRSEMHPTLNILDLMYRTDQAMKKNVPSTIAAMTGGEYELFATRKKFEVHMNDFTNHLHSRYLLSFVPENPHAGLHQIRVRLRDGSDRPVLARSNYWAEGTR